MEEQTGQALGYVEQLYTFGDLNRQSREPGTGRTLSIGYLALVREARPAGSHGAAWQSWYRYFPWEDWRNGKPAILGEVEQRLVAWARRHPMPPSGIDAGSGSASPSGSARPPGTRSGSWSATSFSTSWALFSKRIVTA